MILSYIFSSKTYENSHQRHMTPFKMQHVVTLFLFEWCHVVLTWISINFKKIDGGTIFIFFHTRDTT